MRFGIHLPQYGRAAGPDSIRRAAQQAEELGFADVWVSEHPAVPRTANYPPPFLYDALGTLEFAAAVTDRVGLGTSVLILPYHQPVLLAKRLASLDQLSGGRLILGSGVGWLEGEFAALGVPYGERVARAEETIAVLRTYFADDPASYSGKFTQFTDIRTVPKPAHPIPIWLGGMTPKALARAARLADGWHGMNITPVDVAPIAAQLRSESGDPDFVCSMRLGHDGLNADLGAVAEEIAGYVEAGIDHVMTAPAQPDLDSWLRSVEALWNVFSKHAG